MLRDQVGVGAQRTRVHQIVRREQIEKAASRVPGHLLEVGRKPDVVAILDKANARIVEPFHNLPRVVRRGIVGHDDLEVVEILIEDALYGLPNIGAMVVTGNTDGKEGAITHCHGCSIKNSTGSRIVSGVVDSGLSTQHFSIERVHPFDVLIDGIVFEDAFPPGLTHA